MAVQKSWAPALVGTLLIARLGGAFLIDVEILTGDPNTPLMRLCRPDASTVPENSRLDVFVINPDEISCEGAGVAIGQGRYVPSWGFDDITKAYYREDENVQYSIRPRSSLVTLSQPADNPEKMEFAYRNYNLLNGFGAEPHRFYFGDSELSGDKSSVMPSMFRVLRRGGYQRLWGEDSSLETGDTLIFSGPPDGIPVRLVVNPTTVPTPIGELVIYWLHWLPQSQIDTGKLVPARLTVASLGNRETSIKGAGNWERAKYRQLQALPLREDEWGTGKPAPGWDLFPDEIDLPEQIARLRIPPNPADFEEKKRKSDIQKYQKYLKDKDERRVKESGKREVVSGLNGLIDSIIEKNYRPRVRNQLAKIEKFEQEMKQKAWEERKKDCKRQESCSPPPRLGGFGE